MHVYALEKVLDAIQKTFRGMWKGGEGDEEGNMEAYTQTMRN